MKKAFLIVILLMLIAKVNAQEFQRCGTERPGVEWEDEFQKLIKQLNVGEEKKTTNFTIPIIFHILHSGQAVGNFPNLSQGQINAQVIVLNQDFSGNAYNAASYPANAFTTWAVNQVLPSANLDVNGRVKIADMGMQFCLAQKDMLGNLLAEPGIDRIDFTTAGWSDPASFPTQLSFKSYLDSVVKPQSIWDVTKYLNVWISDKHPLLSSGGVSSVPPFSGLAGIPNTATDSTDGIWCYAKATGSNLIFPGGHYASSVVDGRTLTHEAGHYFGLRHIWGDGPCATDYCSDTPPAASDNSGTPTYPHHAGSCSSPSNNPDGEMFMNFMDYTVGPAKYMFTVDQMMRVQAAMLNSPFRNQLGTHGLCTTTRVPNIPHRQSELSISPNPALDFVRIDPGNSNLLSLKIFDLTGRMIEEHLTTKFSVAHLLPGMYILVAQTQVSILFGRFVKL